MLKRFIATLGILAGLLSPALAAGTIPLSLSQQNDEFGKPLAGCRLYIIQAGTTSTPQTAYQDSALTIPLPNPIICDAAGRLPQFFLADGSIKIRLAKSTGVNVVTADGILVVGASSGGGGGSPVDATTILATGDLKPRYGTGILSGFVRCNGRTIGSATSGATERANADVQTLFEYLWQNDANLTVSGGRGASANADWVANKTIAIPDWRGRNIGFLDDMGNSAASVLTSSWFGTSAIVLGASGGFEKQTLDTTQMPAHAHTGTASSHTHFSTIFTRLVGISTVSIPVGGGASVTAIRGDNAVDLSGDNTSATAPALNINNAGDGLAHPIMNPTRLATCYLKL